MNKLTIDLSKEILKSPDAWQAVKSGRMTVGFKPKLHYVHEQLRQAREALFYDEVYFPHMARLMEKVKGWNLLPGVEWEQVEMGYSKAIFVWWPRTFDTESEFSDYIGNHLQFYLETIWDGEDWAYCEPTEAELLALDAAPSMVVVQPVLF